MTKGIKSFAWTADGQELLKMESVSAHLADVAQEKTVALETGCLTISCVSLSMDGAGVPERTAGGESKHGIPIADGDPDDNADEMPCADMAFDDDSNTIILYENTDYWVSYHAKSEAAALGMLDCLLAKKTKNGGIFNSGNYVGILDAGLPDFQIAVKSRKVDYDRDFQYLREGISAFCSELLGRSSSYYSEHFHKTEEYAGERISYTELAYLKEMLQPDFLPAWLDRLVNRAEHRYTADIGQKELSEAEDVDCDFYLKALMSGDVILTDKVKGRAGALKIAPRVIDCYEYEITYDTNENRFVKFFITMLKGYLDEILAAAATSNGKLAGELAKMQAVVDEKLAHPFWNRITDMQGIPLNSQILQKKYPYNLIFQMYTDFLMKARIDLGEVDRRYLAGQKDAPVLYQYWVFLMLFQYLAKKYQGKYTASDWIAYDGKNLNFTLAEGRESYARFEIDEARELFLFYNKTYDADHAIGEGRSYSHKLRPDISLELRQKKELAAILCFDAKYRLSKSGTAASDDIDKMHTYKDGILRTVGAFAVCLAERPVLYCEKDGIFPSVGACPLRLNPQTLEAELSYIGFLIEEFVKRHGDLDASVY